VSLQQSLITEGRLIRQYLSDTYAHEEWTPETGDGKMGHAYFKNLQTMRLPPLSTQSRFFTCCPKVCHFLFDLLPMFWLSLWWPFSSHHWTNIFN